MSRVGEDETHYVGTTARTWSEPKCCIEELSQMGKHAYLPIRLTPIFAPFNPSNPDTSSLFAPVLMAQHSGVSTYVPTILYPASLLSVCALPRPAIQPSVRPMPMSMSLDWRDVIMWPVPEGKGTRVHCRWKCSRAKWRGVEKCSGDC